MRGMWRRDICVQDTRNDTQARGSKCSDRMCQTKIIAVQSVHLFGMWVLEYVFSEAARRIEKRTFQNREGLEIIH